MAARSPLIRHSSAALLIKSGQHAKVIQERLGHASIKTTLDVYGHLFPGMDEAAAEALNEAARGVGEFARRAVEDRKGWTGQQT